MPTSFDLLHKNQIPSFIYTPLGKGKKPTFFLYIYALHEANIQVPSCIYTSHYNYISCLFLRKDYTMSYKLSSIIALSLALLALNKHLGLWAYDRNVQP